MGFPRQLIIDVTNGGQHKPMRNGIIDIVINELIEVISRHSVDVRNEVFSRRRRRYRLD
jgi:hypothetical protein